MSKEQLEDAKQMVLDFEEEYESRNPIFTYKDMKLLNYLKEQAERVQELEDKVDSVMDDAFHINGKNIELEQQNKRYRKDLCSVNEELITLLEIDTLTDDDKRDCLETAMKIIEEALEDEPNE